jgi:hypothetical protein
VRVRVTLFEVSSFASAVSGAAAGTVTGAQSGILLGTAGLVVGGAIGVGTYLAAIGVAAAAISMSEKRSWLPQAAAAISLAFVVFSPYVGGVPSAAIVYWSRQALGM